MASTAGALGKGALFEFAGKSYTVAPWTMDVQAEYEKYLIAKAYAELRAQKDELGPEYADERARLRQDVTAGVYEFGQPYVFKTLNSHKNSKHLLYLCLQHGQVDRPDLQIYPDLVDEIAQDPAIFKAAMDAMEAANIDPNRKPPTSSGEPAAS